MAWWDNLWLNEGFASWMATKCSDHFNPQWHIWLRSNADKQLAMTTDALAATHPIQQPVKTESEAQSAFDEITYQKGQSFLRMLESYLGEAGFPRRDPQLHPGAQTFQFHDRRPLECLD